MSNPQQISRCQRGARCLASELTPEGVKVAAPCDRPLCDVCESSVARVLDDAPALYVQLRNATLIRTQAVRTEMVKASRNSPLPLNGQALHLAEQLHWLLTTWEDEVRSIASLAYPERDGKREGRQVAEAAQLLGSHLTAWIAAPEREFQITRNSDNGSFDYHRIEQSGTAAACDLLDWRNTVRNVPGLDTKASKAVRKYEHPCPACGVRAVTHRAGDDLMQCQSCHATALYLPTLPRSADYHLKESA